MKNTIAKFLIPFMFLIFSCASARAQSDILSGLTIKEGHMTGTVAARFSVETQYEATDMLKVDCPEPPEAYPAEILTVTDRYVSKKQIQQALKAAGQSTQGKFVTPRGSAVYTGDWNAQASASISKEDAAAQAIEIACTYFEALGVEVELVPASVSRPYDYDAWMDRQQLYYEHRFSDTSTFIENAKAQWKRTSKYHPKQTEYTSVTFHIKLDGMKLDMTPSYPAGYKDEPDAWVCEPTEAHAIVSDSGILVEASCTLLEITSRRPLKGDPAYESFLHQLKLRTESIVPGRSWQEALTLSLSDSSRVMQLQKNSIDAPYKNQNMAEPIIAYGSRTVVSEISPILHTISKNTWAPFWTIETMQEYADGWRN